MHILGETYFHSCSLLIQSKPTNSEKIEEIIVSLRNRPDVMYVKFAWAIMETDQTHHLRHIGMSREELDKIDMLMVVISPVMPLAPHSTNFIETKIVPLPM